MGADVVKLLDRNGPIALDRLRHAPKVGDYAIIAWAEIAACQNGRGMHRHGLDDDHPSAAQGSFRIICHVPFRGHAIFSHIGSMCAEYDAVPQRTPA
jgi:hypothetical protein